MLDGYKLDIIRKIILPIVLGTNVSYLVLEEAYEKNLARTVAVGLSTFWGSVEVQWGPMPT